MDLKALLRKALHFLLLHLSITLVSLPILVAWGLPLSLLSPLGNLLFAPALTVFLLVSSLLFFCQLLFVPTAIITYLVDSAICCCNALKVPNIPNATLGFPSHAHYALAALPIITLALLHMRKLHTPQRRTAALAIALVIMGVTLYSANKPYAQVIPLACNGKEIYVVTTNKETTLIDTGALGRKSSASWASHDLMQEVTKQTGRTSIDHVITLQPGTFTFEALCALHEKTTVGRTYVPCWHGTLKPSAYRAFKKLHAVIKRQKQELVRTGNTTNSSVQGAPFNLIATDKKISSSDATYPVIEMSCLIDNKKTCFYPAKHKKVPDYGHNSLRSTPHAQKKSSSYRRT